MGYVYLLQSYDEYHERIFKIGFTRSNPEKRIKQLQTGNSEKIELLFSYESEYFTKIEKTLHNLFSIYNKSGEWFKLDNPNIFIDECKRIEKNIIFLNENQI